MTAQMYTGPNLMSYRSDSADGWHVAAQSGRGCVFVSVSNGTSRMEHALTMDDAKALAHALTVGVMKAAHNVIPEPIDSTKEAAREPGL